MRNRQKEGAVPMDLQQLIDSHHRIVFFGGAGVSTESGIPDFRSVDGLYNQKYRWPPEEILSHTFFARMPEEFFRNCALLILILLLLWCGVLIAADLAAGRYRRVHGGDRGTKSVGKTRCQACFPCKDSKK